MELRPYQQECVSQIVQQFKELSAFLCSHSPEEIAASEVLQRRLKRLQKALVVLPTAAGKTIIFCSADVEIRHFIEEQAGQGLNSLILAHREELLKQAAEKYRLLRPDMQIGQVGAGRYEWGAPITVASVSTLARPAHLKQLKHFGFQFVVIDECFPAGTLIDGRPIEQIKPGDLITAFDDTTGTYAQKKVARTFRNPVKKHLLKITSDSYSVVCTPNHPFYTSSGWKTAQELTSGEAILHARNHSIMRRVPSTIQPCHKNTTRQLLRREERLLPPGMQQSASIPNIIKDYGRNEQKICFSSDENKQSYEKRNIAGKDAINDPCYGTLSTNTGRQWERPNNSTTNVSQMPEMANGICNKDWYSTQATTTLPNQLQNRHSQSGTHGSYRSGWEFTSIFSQESPGYQENRISYWARVDSIEVYKPGSDGTFGGLCRDGYVYNFEVEDYHTYIANGFVVHNCHHVPAKGYQHIIAALPRAFFLYVTATPDRLDNKPVLEHPPLFSRSILDMIPQGYLCNLKAIAVRTQTSLENIGRSMGDYNEGELAEVVDNERRNRRIVDAYLEHAEGRQFLCFCVNIQHAEHVAATFQASFVPVALITGKTPPDLRARYLSDYQAGRLSGLVNVNVLTEGTDLPCTSCIILARPTQSRALFVQALGRGLRLADGKENCVLLDITDNVLTHRLEPMNLSTALNRRIGNNESLLEMLEREEREVSRRREAAEREEQERIIRQKQRKLDLVLDLLRRFHWQQNEAGYYILEVGPLKHRIAVIPDRTNPDLWRVGAKLAPLFKFQLWQSDPMPLDWALSYADREATRLLAESTYHYRPSNLATPKQITRLDKWHIEYPKDSNGNCLLTKEEASRIIEEKIQEFEERRKKREEQIVYL